jgi:hypothetical protein
LQKNNHPLLNNAGNIASLPNLHKNTSQNSEKKETIDEISKLVSAQDEIIKHLTEQNDYLKK